MMRDDKNRVMERRLLPPQAMPRLLGLPSRGMTAEHVPSHDRRADVYQLGLEHLRVLVVVAPGLAVPAPPGPKGDDPLMESFAAEAEGLLQALVRSGSVAVERHRDTQTQLGHVRSP